MECETELELSARLFRALTHRIRGDLSVITNDLAFLSSLVDPNEVERPRARCAQIATTLSALSALSKLSGKDVLPTGEALSLFSLSGIPLRDEHSRVELDRNLVREALVLVRSLVGEWSAGCVERSDSERLVVKLSSPWKSQMKQEYDSVSAFASAELGERSVVEGCVADLIFREHGWRVHVSSENDTLALTFTIPVRDRGV